MNRKLLLVAFLSTIALTILAASHQLTNAAANMAPPPQHAPSIALMTTAVTPTWQIVAGGGGKAASLSDVSLSSPTDGWAVGWAGLSSYGALFHYDGATWSQTQIPTGTYSLNAVAMISPTEGWAVGYNACYGACDSNLLMHYTQTGWQRVALPPHPSGGYSAFYDIDIKGSAGWIVGDTGDFLQFSGSSWTPITAPLDSAKAVSVMNADEAWAVGANYSDVKSNIAHWTSGTWSLVTPTYSLLPNYVPQLSGVAVSGAGDGWAVGASRYSSRQAQCLMVHYVSGTWVQVACPSVNVVLNAVAMRSSNDVWAVGHLGGSLASSGDGVIYHYNGSTWMTTTLPSATPNLNSVELVGANDGWIVGSGGTILRLVSGTWTRVQGSGLYVGPISSVSTNEVWFGGQAGQITRWQNGALTQFTGSLTTPIHLLQMVNSQVGWGDTNQPYRIFRYSDGVWTTWQSSPKLSMDMIGPDEGWFGDYGGVWHYHSGIWEWQSGPNSYGAGALSMLDPNHGWAVSANNFRPTAVVTYTAGTWAAVTPTLIFPGLYQVLKVIGISPSEAWVSGYSMSCTVEECPISAELDHFVGGAWNSISMPDWRAFLDISKVSATEWWAAGKLKTEEYAFLHYKDGVFTTVPAAGEDVGQVSMLSDGFGFASGVGSLLRFWLDLPNKVYLPIVRR